MIADNYEEENNDSFSNISDFKNLTYDERMSSMMFTNLKKNSVYHKKDIDPFEKRNHEILDKIKDNSF